MRVLVVAIILFFLVGVALMFVPMGERGESEDVQAIRDSYGEVGAFVFTDERGEAFSSENLRGKVWLAYFVFTSCTAECPILSRRVAEIRRNLQGHDDAAFISFSVDPQTDTPERLANFADTYGSEERWKLLTGDPDKLDTLVKQYFLLPVASDFHERSDIANTNFLHSNKLIVVDQKGHIRSFVDGMEPNSVDKVTEVMEILLHQI